MLTVCLIYFFVICIIFSVFLSVLTIVHKEKKLCILFGSIFLICTSLLISLSNTVLRQDNRVHTKVVSTTKYNVQSITLDYVIYGEGFLDSTKLMLTDAPDERVKYHKSDSVYIEVEQVYYEQEWLFNNFYLPREQHNYHLYVTEDIYNTLNKETKYVLYESEDGVDSIWE